MRLYHSLGAFILEEVLQPLPEKQPLLPEGFPGGADDKESAYKAGDVGSIPRSGRSPGGGHGNPLQCSCLENPMDRGARWATVHGVVKRRTRLGDKHFEAFLSFFWPHHSPHRISVFHEFSRNQTHASCIGSMES